MGNAGECSALGIGVSGPVPSAPVRQQIDPRSDGSVARILGLRRRWPVPHGDDRASLRWLLRAVNWPSWQDLLCPQMSLGYFSQIRSGYRKPQLLGICPGRQLLQ